MTCEDRQALQGDETNDVPDEAMDHVVGGSSVEASQQAGVLVGSCPPCPYCNSSNTHPYPGFPGLRYFCEDCGVAFF